MNCDRCGAPLTAGEIECLYCGAKVPAPAEVPAPAPIVVQVELVRPVKLTRTERHQLFNAEVAQLRAEGMSYRQAAVEAKKRQKVRDRQG
jgi:uncharacterized Zn finger protein (UPF0148 family)